MKNQLCQGRLSPYVGVSDKTDVIDAPHLASGEMTSA
jgi:hypothetical protein